MFGRPSSWSTWATTAGESALVEAAASWVLRAEAMAWLREAVCAGVSEGMARAASIAFS